MDIAAPSSRKLETKVPWPIWDFMPAAELNKKGLTVSSGMIDPNHQSDIGLLPYSGDRRNIATTQGSRTILFSAKSQ